MIVIPMAGESRRFLAAGYDRPKYMLPLEGRPLFDWTILSFQTLFAAEPFLFIARDVHGTAAFIRDRLNALGLPRAEVVLLQAPTAGQAETVEQGLAAAAVADDMPLAIFNIDTIRPGIAETALPGTEGWLEVFRSTGDNWSFVDPEAPGSPFVRRCTEKQRISDLCCTGLYAFAAARHFHEALAAERAAPSSHELFVAPLYNHLIARGQRIAWREVPAERVILAGVPAEYEALRATPGALTAAFELKD
jgi:hypothetical protein